VEREIADSTRAVARGDFTFLESALRAAEQRRTIFQAELAGQLLTRLRGSLADAARPLKVSNSGIAKALARAERSRVH
jgi:hypothetical protein